MRVFLRARAKRAFSTSSFPKFDPLFPRICARAMPLNLTEDQEMIAAWNTSHVKELEDLRLSLIQLVNAVHRAEPSSDMNFIASETLRLTQSLPKTHTLHVPAFDCCAKEDIENANVSDIVSKLVCKVIAKRRTQFDLATKPLFVHMSDVALRATLLVVGQLLRHEVVGAAVDYSAQFPRHLPSLLLTEACILSRTKNLGSTTQKPDTLSLPVRLYTSFLDTTDIRIENPLAIAIAENRVLMFCAQNVPPESDPALRAELEFLHNNFLTACLITPTLHTPPKPHVHIQGQKWYKIN